MSVNKTGEGRSGIAAAAMSLAEMANMEQDPGGVRFRLHRRIERETAPQARVPRSYDWVDKAWEASLSAV
jgi:hypothetical protein